MTSHHLSQATYERLTAELADLTSRGRIDIARKIQAARELGDLSENGDYHAAKDEQGKMEARIRQLERHPRGRRDRRADRHRDRLRPGTIVDIRYDGDDDVERYLDRLHRGAARHRRHQPHLTARPGAHRGEPRRQGELRLARRHAHRRGRRHRGVEPHRASEHLLEQDAPLVGGVQLERQIGARPVAELDRNTFHVVLLVHAHRADEPGVAPVQPDRDPQDRRHRPDAVRGRGRRAARTRGA